MTSGERKPVDLTRGYLPIAPVIALLASIIGATVSLTSQIGNVRQSIEMLAFRMDSYTATVERLESTIDEVKDRSAARDLEDLRRDSRLDAIEHRLHRIEGGEQ